MKAIIKPLFIFSTVAFVAACSSPSTGWKRIGENEIDQKSYAITYAGTAQTYEGRVNDSYDIVSYTKGVDDYFNNKNALPIEQIRGSLLNRMLDNDVYAYYSGILDAHSFKTKFTYLSPECWALIHLPSATQGINDAMIDLQKNQVRTNEEYIKQGADEILHQCVGKVEEEAQAQPTPVNQKKSKSKKSAK